MENFYKGPIMTIRNELEKRREEVVRRVRGGESLSSIAKDFSCNSGTVWYFLESIGISSNKKLKEYYGKLELKKEEIIRLFKEGNSAYKIAQIVGAKKNSILKRLNNWGYDTSAKCSVDYSNLLKDKLDYVIDLYKEGKSVYQISKIVEHSYASVWKLLNDNGYNTSRNKTKYDVDEEFFDVL